MQGIIAKARNIKLAVFDVDGVLTDGGLILGEGGIRAQDLSCA
jgi:Low specificity phosphatase (HAD superfamily)